MRWAKRIGPHASGHRHDARMIAAPAGFRHRMLAAGLQGLAALRADRWLRRLAQGCGVILMFHRVRPARAQDFAPNRVLEITPEFLDCVLLELRREGFDVIPLE